MAGLISMADEIVLLFHKAYISANLEKYFLSAGI